MAQATKDQGKDQGFGEGVRTIASQASPRALEPKLEEAMEKQPLLPHILDLRVVLTAGAIAAVIALILTVLFAPALGGLGLLITFFASWFVLANRSYEKRRPTEERSDSEDDSDADADSDSDDE